MTILMTILSSEMIGFPYPAYPAFPACSRQGPSLFIFHFLTPLSPLVRGPLPLKKRSCLCFVLYFLPKKRGVFQEGKKKEKKRVGEVPCREQAGKAG